MALLRLFIALAFAGLHAVTATPTPSQPTQYLITFGDSYSQTGFNISGTLPSAGNVLGNPAFPGYTTANGNRSNWIDDLVTVHNRSLLLSYNFASGGATTDASLIPGYEPYPQVLSLVNQVAEFNGSLSKGSWEACNTLFGIFIGVNDVGNGYYQSNWTTTLPEVMTKYFEQMQILYDAGARNFLFLTVPPITHTPLVLNSSDAASIQAEAAAITAYSDMLVQNVEQFKAANKDVTTFLFNTTSPFLEAIDNPTKYGAANATCYDSEGTECLWWNDCKLSFDCVEKYKLTLLDHPGAVIHSLVADGIAKQVGSPWFH